MRSETERADMACAVLETYSTMASHTLSVLTVHNILLPSIHGSLIPELVSGLVPTARDVVARLEEVYGVAPGTAEATATAVNAAKVGMSQSPSLDEMKQKVGKLFQRKPAAGAVSFWKKT